jgi:hypothetical protein
MSSKRFAPSRFASFESFWPYYLGEHANPATRATHVAGIWLGVAVLLWAVVAGPLWLALLAPLTGHAAAWVSRPRTGRNRPAALAYPLWSLRGDLRIAWLAATGRLGAEIRRYGLA